MIFIVSYLNIRSQECTGPTGRGEPLDLDLNFCKYEGSACNITTGPVASCKWIWPKMAMEQAEQDPHWPRSASNVLGKVQSRLCLTEWLGKWKCQRGKSTLGAACPAQKIMFCNLCCTLRMLTMNGHTSKEKDILSLTRYPSNATQECTHLSQHFPREPCMHMCMRGDQLHVKKSLTCQSKRHSSIIRKWLPVGCARFKDYFVLSHNYGWLKFPKITNMNNLVLDFGL